MDNKQQQQLWADREAFKYWRDQARKRGDEKAVRSLTARIGNCTAKMNKLLFASLDETIRSLKKGG